VSQLTVAPSQAVARFVRARVQGTPAQLRLIAVGCVAAALLLGIGGGAMLSLRASALSDANASATHLVTLQSVRTNLVQAQARATNGYLYFGLEPAAQRQDYIASIRSASQDLARAASFSPQDAQALGTANAALTRYTGYVSSSRAFNRVGLTVGASYLQDATEELNAVILPQLTARTSADTSAIAAAYTRASLAGWGLVLVVLTGLGGLVYGQVLLARRTRRIVNVPLAGSTTALLVVLLAGAVVMVLAQSRANDVRSGSLAQVTALSQSRVAAFGARSIESLTVINRGSATSADAAWTQAMGTATSALPAGQNQARQALTDYAERHQAINQDDVNGDWETAVSQVISTADDSAGAAFQTYADQTREALSAQAAQASAGLDRSGALLVPVAGLLLLVGLGAAAGAWHGVSLRWDEYR
jgi:precorrin isomerase